MSRFVMLSEAYSTNLLNPVVIQCMQYVPDQIIEHYSKSLQLQTNEAERQLLQAYRCMYQQIAMCLASEFFGFVLPETVLRVEKLYRPYAACYKLIATIFNHPRTYELYGQDFISKLNKGELKLGSPLAIWRWWFIQRCEVKMRNAGLLDLDSMPRMGKETYRRNINCLVTYSQDLSNGLIIESKSKSGNSRFSINQSGTQKLLPLVQDSRRYTCAFDFIFDVSVALARMEPDFAEGVFREYWEAERSRANFIHKTKNLQAIYVENGQLKFNGRGRPKRL